MNRPITVTLPNHGAFNVSAEEIEMAMKHYVDTDIVLLQAITAGLCGFGNPQALMDLSRFECYVMIVDSGNFVFV